MKLKITFLVLALCVGILAIFNMSFISGEKKPEVKIVNFVLQTEPPTSDARTDGKLSVIKYKDIEVIDTNSIVQRYIDSSLTEFSGGKFRDVWVEYVYDYGDIINGYVESPGNKAHPARMNILRFKSGFQEPIIKDIKIGDSIEEIVSILGNPSFIDKKASLIGYKAKEIYLFIQGKKAAAEISFIKTPSQSQENLIAQYVVSHYKPYYDSKLLNGFMDNRRKINYWDRNIYEYFFGFVFVDNVKANMRIYNNFEGVIPSKTGKITLNLVDEDLIFENQVKYYLEKHEKFYSPDKKHYVVKVIEEQPKISVYETSEENPPIVLRFFDNQFADWLSSHEVLITYGLDSTEYMSFDLRTQKLKTKTELETHATPIHDSDFIVGDFKLDMTFSSFKKVADGKFVKIKSSIYNSDIKVNTYRLKDGSIVEFYDGRLGNVLLKSKKYATNRGLKVGDSLNKALKLYGLPHDLEGDSWHYNYDYADDGEVFVVTFENDKVKSIYVTMLD